MRPANTWFAWLVLLHVPVPLQAQSAPRSIPSGVVPALCSAIQKEPEVAELAAILPKGVHVLDRTRFLGTGLLFHVYSQPVRELVEKLRVSFVPRDVPPPPPGPECPVMLISIKTLEQIASGPIDSGIYVEFSNPFVNSREPPTSPRRIGVLAVVSSSSSDVIYSTRSTWFWVGLRESADHEWAVAGVEYLGWEEQ